MSRSRHRSFGPEPRRDVEDIAGRSPSSTVSRQCASSGGASEFLCPVCGEGETSSRQGRGGFQPGSGRESEAGSRTLRGLGAIGNVASRSSRSRSTPTTSCSESGNPPSPRGDRGLQAELATLRCSTFQDDESSLKKRRAAPSTPLAIGNGSSTPQ